MSKLLPTMLAVLIAAFPLGVQAGCLETSQTVLTVVEAADVYSIARETWRGNPAYDQVMPLCAKSLVREIACQGLVNIAIRRFEKPTPGTCAANYIAAFAYAWYIRRAVSTNIIRF